MVSRSPFCLSLPLVALAGVCLSARISPAKSTASKPQPVSPLATDYKVYRLPVRPCKRGKTGEEEKEHTQIAKCIVYSSTVLEYKYHWLNQINMPGASEEYSRGHSGHWTFPSKSTPQHNTYSYSYSAHPR
ncbi:hypothetical protein C7212DRAFT_345121 [Tuber magnatum]|uniref:Secreted protein n=1 Tax=Tuber magnatum TaxID=42249 RepID=A0A317SYL7_9PEZI|nr:hypothetical protein C7212DRAFT_345121 [Tuber magnatum]